MGLLSHPGVLMNKSGAGSPYLPHGSVISVLNKDDKREVLLFMRSIFRSVLVALVAVSALGAVAAASALAAQWRENGAPVTETKPVTYTGTIKFEGGAEDGAFKCNISGKGTIKGAEGSATEVTFSGCNEIRRPTICEASKPFTVKPIHLPWRTSLFENFRHEVGTQLTGNTEQVGFQWECTALGIKITESCSDNNRMQGRTLNEEALGEVRESYGNEEPEFILCNHTKETGPIHITNYVKAGSGAKLTVTKE
jgi:hypothetical protein